MHTKLMTGVRGNQATPGEFRRSQNWISPAGCTLANATYVPPPPEAMTQCLEQWELFLHDHSLPPLVHVAVAHYQFEAIHPFLDGNGRVGRLLITLFLVERGILPTPLLYLSAFFEATRRDYYDHLLGVSRHGEWAAWLAYFLGGVARQAEDALSRAERINNLLVKWRAAVAGSASKTPLALIDLLAANPYLTITHTARALGVAFTTVQRAVGQLESLSIVKIIGQAKRDRVYCAGAILRILEEPAPLKGRQTGRSIESRTVRPA
ncbi:MAG: Fic family protein [Acidobacteriaceae bacterium]